MGDVYSRAKGQLKSCQLKKENLNETGVHK